MLGGAQGKRDKNKIQQRWRITMLTQQQPINTNRRTNTNASTTLGARSGDRSRKSSSVIRQTRIDRTFAFVIPRRACPSGLRLPTQSSHFASFTLVYSNESTAETAIELALPYGDPPDATVIGMPVQCHECSWRWDESSQSPHRIPDFCVIKILYHNVE